MNSEPAAPDIPGFVYVEHIGRGGFADVYLYEQQFPTRKVAVKVLDSFAQGGNQLEQFRAEANVMAQLSGHPSIVPIYGADVSPAGHPYIVMEYCPPPALGQRYRSSPFSPKEALDVGIKISGAVETAHRAGILHRDIKPPNILMSAFGVPKLTDFGIAGTAGSDAGASVYGVSVPWAAPEMLSDVDIHDVRSDVWALAATVYTFLAGRSPFEVAGLNNDNSTLMHRIQHQPLAVIGRNDVPSSLEDALRVGMAKDLADRPNSALDFVQSLQRVQEELGFQVTWAEVFQAADNGDEASVAFEQRTRLRPVSIVVPAVIAEHGTRLRPRTITPQPLPEPVRMKSGGLSDRTSLRPARGRRESMAHLNVPEHDDLSQMEQELSRERRSGDEQPPVTLPAPLATMAVLVLVALCVVVALFVLRSGAAA